MIVLMYLKNLDAGPFSYQIRQATSADAEKIALLHASSWRKAYRGILSDEYLGNDLEEERKITWVAKMAKLTNEEFVLLAENKNDLLGFAAVLDKPEAGIDVFIDNLHVRWDMKGQGIGKQLMKSTAEQLLQSGRKSVYLWVLKGNDPAEKFYFSRGAKRADSSLVLFGGREVEQSRFVWPSLDVLMK